MNANPDQLAAPRLKADSSAETYQKSHKVSSVGPPASRKAWFNNYDEEWAAFLAKSALKKSHPGINNEDPETLPRVWNSPHE
jgi:hypothetical protein